MFFYITSRLEQGYKVGIASDIDQRQQQYTTLIPNIKFNLAVQTECAEEIETSFKQRFLNHRVVNKTSSKEMKSEVYKVKLQYLIMHFMNCTHISQRAGILIDNNLAFSKNEYLNNKINLYLPNYYLPFKDKEKRFKRFSHSTISPKIKIGEISSVDSGISDKKTQMYSGKLEYYDFDKTSWQKISKLYLENDMIFQNDIIKGFNIKKTKNFNELILFNNLRFSPYKLALNFISNLWFKKLIDFKILRQFSQKKLEEKGGFSGGAWSDKFEKGARLAPSHKLRFIGYPYHLKSTKIILD